MLIPLLLDGSRAALNLDSNVISSEGSKGSQEKQLELGAKCCLLLRYGVEKEPREQLAPGKSFGSCDINPVPQILSFNILLMEIHRS